MNLMAKDLVLLIKDESIRILYGEKDKTEWKPQLYEPRLFAQPIVHFLFGGNRNVKPLEKTLLMEFTDYIPKAMLRRNVYAIIPDDYTVVEKKAIEDFLYMSCRAKMLYILSMAECIGIQTEIYDYIGLTGTKRCMALNRVVQGQNTETEYIQWNRAESELGKILGRWEQLPIFMCDPNGLLSGYRDLCDEEVVISEVEYEKYIDCFKK